ncbi:MAG TPA: class I SAM-dependent methyltransferase [Saprospiraceae bacterium]|nr:class I SAM-dependent methyltransferase [Saprospiraceae bacterium]
METNPEAQQMIDMTCPACGSHDWKDAGQVKDYSISGEWFGLKECTSCHLKATFPQPVAHELGRYYASSDYISHSDTKKGLINKIYHLARRYMLEKKYDVVSRASRREMGSLLDVGAGTGHFAHYMSEYHWDVTALEPDENARKVGAEKLEMEIHPLEVLGQLKEDSFDVITLWHVLEHVQDISGYISHFKTLLRKDGVLIIAVPNHTSRDAKQYGMKWAAYDVPRHLWHFSPASMEKLLTTHGFELAQKLPMPLDAFYVSMLSEKYRENSFFGPVFAFISGVLTWLVSMGNVDKASSIIYIAK